MNRRVALTAMALAVLALIGVAFQSPPTPVGLTIVGANTTPDPPLRPNETFRVQMYHVIRWYEYATDGLTAIPCHVTGGSVFPPAPNCFGDTSDYELLIDDVVKQKQTWSQNVGSVVTFTVTGGLPAVGTYVVRVRAVGPGGSAVSDPPVMLPIQ